ncbi:MAG: DNA starvation/stationary phase protection protein DpsA [Halobacteriaceae archaeon]
MSSGEHAVRQQPDETRDNPLRIEAAKAEEIAGALNTDLANAYVLFHQLHKHHWNVAGAEHLTVHRFLQEAYEAVEAAADELAERVQTLGGVPHARMTALASASTVDPEDETVYDVRTSLGHDLDVYGEIIEGYREHVSLAHDLGDFGTEEMLRQQLLTLEEHAHVLDHFLEDDTLVTEDAL